MRIQTVDVARGVAIVLMVCYHFTYDLNHFRLVAVDLYHGAFWLVLRTLIVSLFLTLVGVSLVLASAGGLDRRRYLRRLGVLVACAAAISVITHFMFPGRMVFFGILHLIAFASLAGLLFVGRPRASAVLGVALVLLPQVAAHPFFNQAPLQWIGLMTYKPPTEDYVPVLPWFGVVLIGIALGHLVQRADWLRSLRQWPASPPPARVLALLGRHSLLIYLVHQPVLFGVLAAIVALTARA